MKRYSQLFGKYYDGSKERVLYITDITQNLKYWQTESIWGDLLDIFAGENRMVFVYRKSKNMQELYEKWKNHEFDDKTVENGSLNE